MIVNIMNNTYIIIANSSPKMTMLRYGINLPKISDNYDPSRYPTTFEILSTSFVPSSTEYKLSANI